MLLIEKCIKMVEINRIYNHVLSLEGIRHPLDSYEALIQGAEYIENTLQQQGLETNRHYFTVEGQDEEFYNIEGFINLRDQIDWYNPILLVTSHYDTVFTTPGADDNASGVAIMLEIARILKEIGYEKNVLFVSFNLEEWSPYLLNKIRKLGVKYGVYNKDYRFVSWPLQKHYNHYRNLIAHSGIIKPFLDGKEWEKFEESAKQELTKDQLEYFREQNLIRRKTGEKDPIGSFAILGSSIYAKRAVERKMNIKGVINLEMVGFTSTKSYSQRFPSGISLKNFEKYKIAEHNMIGNFSAIYSDKASSSLASTFFQSCQHEAIDLPCINFAAPLSFEEIVTKIPSSLSSDHAPFWKHGFPAIMITDTARNRNPYYHTGGDTINTLDFSFMKKICQATLATVIEFQKE